jgi:4-hydroxybenzoate polyprenyltransferase
VSTTRAIVATLRPRQWVKNSFVLAPLVFSKHLFDPSYAIRAAIATAAFCAISGAVYAFNDVRDIEQDRAHPIKKHRPIAAGALTERAALWMAAGFAAAALGVSAALSLQLLAVIGGYFAIQLAYSIKLKHIAFLDVAIIAGGFLLRVVAGAFAIDVPMSPWLLACTGLLAGLLGFGKRAHELIGAGDSAADTRAALAGYSAGVLQAAMYLLALATVAAYALYTRDHRTVAYFGTGNLIWTLPFCIIGIARFLSLALWKPRADSPTDAILRDWTFMANLLLWGGTVLLIIYGARSGPADAGAAMTVRLSHPIPVEGAMPASIDDAHLSAIDPIATRDDGALAWRLTDVLSDMPGGNSQLEIAGAAGVRTTIAGPTEMAGGREVLVVGRSVRRSRRARSARLRVQADRRGTGVAGRGPRRPRAGKPRRRSDPRRRGRRRSRRGVRRRRGGRRVERRRSGPRRRAHQRPGRVGARRRSDRADRRARARRGRRHDGRAACGNRSGPRPDPHLEDQPAGYHEHPRPGRGPPGPRRHVDLPGVRLAVAPVLQPRRGESPRHFAAQGRPSVGSGERRG